MSVFTIELGATVKSNQTGFTGIVTSRSEHINGCNRYWVQPPVDKDGKLVDGAWVDENELDIWVDENGEEKPIIGRRQQKRGGFPSSIK